MARQNDEVEKSIGQLLDEQPKVKIRIFIPAEERKKLEAEKEAGLPVVWPTHEVVINGYSTIVPKGVDVEVPQSVAEVLEQAGLI